MNADSPVGVIANRDTVHLTGPPFLPVETFFSQIELLEPRPAPLVKAGLGPYFSF
jgi:hypothetical protein